jgi:GDP-L-fucose synthase
MTYMELESRVNLDLRGKRVWVAGHTGLVGSALVRRLSTEGCRVLTATHAELDLTRQADTEAWIKRERPQVIFIAAARVGGILANSRYPAEFLYDNLMIAANIMRTAHMVGVEKLICLGSSCIYPREAPQPIPEEALLTGPLEVTNEAYAVAKIAGLKLAQSYFRQYGDCFVTAMPTNLYGPGDNYDLDTSHVLPALIRKFHEAKLRKERSVTVWGTGRPRREFLHSDDMADACVHLMELADRELDERLGLQRPPLVNVGCGEDLTIAELAMRVREAVGRPFCTTIPKA